MENTELIFPEGIRAFKAKAGGPPSIKLNLTIRPREFIEWLGRHDNGTDDIRLDLRKSLTKDSLYFTLNTYKKEKVDDVGVIQKDSLDI